MNFFALHHTSASSGQDSGGHPWRRRWLLLGVGGLIPFLAVVLVAGCGQTSPPANAKKPIDVVVTTPVQDDVADYQDFTGRLDSVDSVQVQARVGGYLDKANFIDGADVKQGAVLYEIDPRPYRAALDQVEAQVRLQQANLKYQEALYKRDVALAVTGAVSQEQLQQDQASRDTAQAAVNAARANVETARLNLEWTKVLAPVSGRLSRTLITRGNLVVADNTLLTSIVSTNPMRAYFDVDERSYLELPWSPTAGNSIAGLQPPVLMSLANQDKFSRTGFVDFIDNRVNANTGTVRMRGVFENKDGALKPGLFVRVRLPLSSPYRALLISDEVIMSDQGRKYVYVLNDKNEVVYRRVKIGQEIEGLRVIKEGLSGGERVIVSGLQRVRPGVQVQPTMQEPPKPPPSPLVRLLAASRRTPEGGGQKAEDTTRKADGSTH